MAKFQLHATTPLKITSEEDTHCVKDVEACTGQRAIGRQQGRLQTARGSLLRNVIVPRVEKLIRESGFLFTLLTRRNSHTYHLIPHNSLQSTLCYIYIFFPSSQTHLHVSALIFKCASKQRKMKLQVSSSFQIAFTHSGLSTFTCY